MQHPLVKLAELAVTSYITKGATIVPPDWIPKKYINTNAGTFVTIKENNELRGCIGTYAPTKENVAKEIITNAIDAATSDPRFKPIGIKDLGNLSYEVYILEKPEQIKSLSELNPQKLGVIVFSSQKNSSALLLPSLEGIDSVEQQLSCVTQKAGIDPRQEKLTIIKFKTEKFG